MDPGRLRWAILSDINSNCRFDLVHWLLLILWLSIWFLDFQNLKSWIRAFHLKYWLIVGLGRLNYENRRISSPPHLFCVCGWFAAEEMVKQSVARSLIGKMTFKANLGPRWLDCMEVSDSLLQCVVSEWPHLWLHTFMQFCSNFVFIGNFQKPWPSRSSLIYPPFHLAARFHISSLKVQPFLGKHSIQRLAWELERLPEFQLKNEEQRMWGQW